MLTSTFGIVMIVIAAVVGLVALEVLVLVAAERPSFKHPHPDQMQTSVRGGIHLGDPRSVSPSPEEEAAPAPEQPVNTVESGQAAGTGAREHAGAAPAGLSERGR